MNLATRTFRREDWKTTSPFGSRIHPKTKVLSFHSGIDFGTNLEHWNIYALEHGKVFASNYDDRNGHYIWIEYPRIDLKVFYCHLQTRSVVKGQSVDENTILGQVGNTGGLIDGIQYKLATHLHMGVKHISNDTYFDYKDYEYQEESIMKFIDISTFQKNVDYKKVKDDGIQGVILRIGHTGYSNKDMVKDALFEEHYKGFKKVGLPIGVYWFSRATTILEGINEAKNTLEFLKDKTIELPIFWDTEDTVYQNKISKERLTSVALAYLDHIHLNGYKVGTYASTSWLNNRLDMSKLDHYDVWVAQYSSKVTYKGRYDMWQYSSSGRVKGIKGNVDMNICYKDYFNEVDEVKEVDPSKRYLYLDKSVVSWRVYPLDKPCLIVNALGKLSPSRFGGLRYEILEDYGNSCYKINTQTYGIVKIYAGKNTKHVIRNY